MDKQSWPWKKKSSDKAAAEKAVAILEAAGASLPTVAPQASQERLAKIHKEQSDSHLSLNKDALSQVHGIEERPRGIGCKTSRTKSLIVEQLRDIKKMKKSNKAKKSSKLEKMDERLMIVEARLGASSKSSSTDANGKDSNSPPPTQSPTYTGCCFIWYSILNSNFTYSFNTMQVSNPKH